MNPAIAHLIILSFFLIGAKVISMIIKRPLNGAFGYLIVGGIFSVIGVLQVFNPDNVPLDQRYYVLGQVVGSLIIPLGLGLFLSQRFKKKHPKLTGESGDTESSNKQKQADA